MSYSDYTVTTTFDIKDVPSSFIERVRYEGYSYGYGTMVITFRKGYEYTYEEISLTDALGFMVALDNDESLGAYFTNSIRPIFQGKRTETVTA